MILFITTFYSISNNTIYMKKGAWVPSLILLVSISYITHKTFDDFRIVIGNLIYSLYWNDSGVLNDLKSDLPNVIRLIFISLAALILPLILSPKFRKTIFGKARSGGKLFWFILFVSIGSILLKFYEAFDFLLEDEWYKSIVLDWNKVLTGIGYQSIHFLFISYLEEFFYVYVMTFFIEEALENSTLTTIKKRILCCSIILLLFISSHTYTFFTEGTSFLNFIRSILGRSLFILSSLYFRYKTRNIFVSGTLHALGNVPLYIYLYLS